MESSRASLRYAKHLISTRLLPYGKWHSSSRTVTFDSNRQDYQTAVSPD